MLCSKCVRGKFGDIAGSSFVFVVAVRVCGAGKCSGGFCSRDVCGAGVRRCDFCSIMFFGLHLCGAFHIFQHDLGMVYVAAELKTWEAARNERSHLGVAWRRRLCRGF